MKYIVIGLGNFGSTLSIALTTMGHEVIGIDKDMQKVNAFKDDITHTICMDSENQDAMRSLPLKDTDVVVVGIGEDFGASVQATALMKQFKVKKIIGRAISDLHQTVIEAIGVDEIVRPEEESAKRLAIRLCTKGVVDLFKVSTDYSIIEVKLPEYFAGKTVLEAGLRTNYNVNIVTILRKKEHRNLLGNKHYEPEVIGIIAPETKFESGDILVLFGKINDINKLMEIE